jgi:glycosyltransferase involved in cell wall biosynthesis
VDSPLSFSFVTAIKDGFPDFAKTIPTVLAQTLPAFEWIIVDDASLSPVAAAFPDLAHDTRVKILRNEQGRGQTASLNTGIRAATGAWIVRMDGDDLCAPDRLARIRQAAESSPDAQLLYSDYLIIDGDDRPWADIRYQTPAGEAFFRYLEHRNNPICHPTTAFRRRKADGALRLYREEIRNIQDYALWKEILRESGRSAFHHIPAATIEYRVVRHSLSGAGAPEQKVELAAIRAGGSPATQAPPTLGESQRNAMQCYRLLYYRFIGHRRPASLAEDLALLGGCAPLPARFARAFFFLLLRPARKLLLPFLFGGIYA